MKHPSLSRKSAIFVNIFLILILTILIIFSSYSLNEDIQFIDNEGINNITKEEIIGNINQSRIINADSEPHNWLAHGRDYNEQRFSPLKKINKENISQLELEWSFDIDTTRGLEATPIVDNGVMFVTNAWSTVHAIDAKTGKELWFYDPNVPRIWSKKACCDVVNRGVAVWKGFVFSATLDGRLLKLDAKTGKLIWEINTITNRELDYTITGAPRIANDKIFIGNGGADMGGVRGYV